MHKVLKDLIANYMGTAPAMVFIDDILDKALIIFKTHGHQFSLLI